MTDEEKLELTVKKLELGPGDALLIQVPPHHIKHAGSSLRYLEKQLPGVPIILADTNYQFSILSKKQLDRACICVAGRSSLCLAHENES
jgi:hypothetical protein